MRIQGPRPGLALPVESEDYEWVDAPSTPQATETFPLFDALPGLSAHVSRIDMIAGNTPVARMRRLETATNGNAQLFVKRDDKSSHIYGGNKVRKFEFTFAKILERAPSSIITGGETGSHMTVAAAAFAQHYGIPIDTVHFAQPVTRHVQQNVRLNRYFGARMHYAKSQTLWALKLAAIFAGASVRAVVQGQRPPFLMLPGDSNALSSLGFVNAALELREQIRRGAVPEPDYIYVAAGSGGTLAGLLVGLRIAGLKTKVVGVRVAAKLVDNKAVVANIANDTLRFLRAHTNGDLPPNVQESDVVLVHDFYGDGYGAPTREGAAAVALAQNSEGMSLETTYTGKAMAAMLAFAKTPEARGKRIMFWNTYNSVDLSAAADSVPNSDIPQPFQELLDAQV